MIHWPCTSKICSHRHVSSRYHIFVDIYQFLVISNPGKISIYLKKLLHWMIIHSVIENDTIEVQLCRFYSCSCQWHHKEVLMSALAIVYMDTCYHLLSDLIPNGFWHTLEIILVLLYLHVSRFIVSFLKQYFIKWYSEQLFSTRFSVF